MRDGLSSLWFRFDGSLKLKAVPGIGSKRAMHSDRRSEENGLLVFIKTIYTGCN